MAQTQWGWRQSSSHGEANQSRSPCSGDSDEELLRAFATERCPHAFACIYRRHADLVVRVCERRLRGHQDAEDVAQSVFLQLALHPERVQVNLAGWLYEVADRLSINRYRSDRSRQAREKSRLQRQSFPEDHGQEELREEIEAALVHLPAPLREAVILCHLEGLTQQEAARVAGCDRGTVSRRIVEAVQRLRSVLASRGFATSASAIFAGFSWMRSAEASAGVSPSASPGTILKMASSIRRRQHLVSLGGGVAAALLLIGTAVGLWSLLANQGPPREGLIGYYAFDEGAGTTAADASSAGNHGALVGSVRWVKDGRKGGALEFDGAGGHVLLTADLGRQLQGDATVCYWIRTRQRGASTWTSPGVVGVTGKRLTDLSGCAVWGCIGLDGRLFVQSGCHGQVVSALPLDDGKWHHIAVVRKAETGLMQFFVDGEPQAERFSEPGPHSQPYRSLGRIEALPGAAEHYFRGTLDEVLLYSRPLSKREIQSLAR